MRPGLNGLTCPGKAITAMHKSDVAAVVAEAELTLKGDGSPAPTPATSSANMGLHTAGPKNSASQSLITGRKGHHSLTKPLHI